MNTTITIITLAVILAVAIIGLGLLSMTISKQREVIDKVVKELENAEAVRSHHLRLYTLEAKATERLRARLDNACQLQSHPDGRVWFLKKGVDSKTL